MLIIKYEVNMLYFKSHWIVVLSSCVHVVTAAQSECISIVSKKYIPLPHFERALREQIYLENKELRYGETGVCYKMEHPQVCK